MSFMTFDPRRVLARIASCCLRSHQSSRQFNGLQTRRSLSAIRRKPRNSIASHHFIRIAGADHEEAGKGAKVGKLLDWLVRWTVLPDANRVVGEDVNDRQLHHGAETDSAASVVAEYQEAGAVWPYFHKAHPVWDGGHGVLTNAEVQIATAVGAGLKISRAIESQPSLGGRTKVCRPSQAVFLMRRAVPDMAVHYNAIGVPGWPELAC